MNDPITIILSGKWGVADVEYLDMNRTAITLYEEEDNK